MLGTHTLQHFMSVFLRTSRQPLQSFIAALRLHMYCFKQPVPIGVPGIAWFYTLPLPHLFNSLLLVPQIQGDAVCTPPRSRPRNCCLCQGWFPFLSTRTSFRAQFPFLCQQFSSRTYHVFVLLSCHFQNHGISGKTRALVSNNSSNTVIEVFVEI